jgi:hypothetical protein
VHRVLRVDKVISDSPVKKESLELDLVVSKELRVSFFLDFD